MTHNNKKYLKRFDMEVMSRLMVTMYESGLEKKTNIARNSKMGYDKCMQYLDCLEILDFVKKKTDQDGHDTYDLTINGIGFCKRRLSHLFEKEKRNDEFSMLV